MTIQVTWKIAVDLLAFISRKPDVATLTEASLTLGVCVSHLEKIATRLKGAGIIESKRGRSGGYLLSNPPETLMLRDILRLFEKDVVRNPTSVGDCLEDMLGKLIVFRLSNMSLADSIALVERKEQENVVGT